MAIVLAWLVVPTYVWYCMSVEQIISPMRALGSAVFISVADIHWPLPRFSLTPPFFDFAFFSEIGRALGLFLQQFAPSNLRLPHTWLGCLLVLFTVAATVGAFMRCGRTMRERVYKLAVITATLGGLVVLCWICFFFYERKHGGSVWMPRYLGFAWPAVAIAVAALLLRLPTRPLRWAAVALLVGVNLAVYSARLFGGTEPPTDRMARDLVDSQPADATVRMYYDVSASRGGPPGGGMLYTLPGSYYLTIYSGKPTNPQEFLTGFMGGRVASKFKRWNVSILPLAPYVFNDAKKTPGLTRLIVWEDFTPKQPVPGDDPVLQRLGDPWKRADEQLFYVRDHWTWRNLLTLRRRVYERGPVPATLPTTATSTNPTTNPG
jgi:hypothetical protein